MHRSTQHVRHARNARGMTLAELVIGLSVMSIVLLAAASFSVAVASGWNASTQSFAASATASRTSAQLDAALRAALAVAQAKPANSADPNTYIFYWRYDGFGGSSDGIAQAGEMALLEYDAGTNSVWLYAPIEETSMTSAQASAAAQSNWGDIASPSVIGFFKEGAYLATRRAVAGPGTDTRSTAARVTSASFSYLAPSGGKPMVSYTLSLTQGDGRDAQTSAATGLITLRSPKVPSNAGGG